MGWVYKLLRPLAWVWFWRWQSSPICIEWCTYRDLQLEAEAARILKIKPSSFGVFQNVQKWVCQIPKLTHKLICCQTDDFDETVFGARFVRPHWPVPRSRSAAITASHLFVCHTCGDRVFYLGMFKKTIAWTLSSFSLCVKSFPSHSRVTKSARPFHFRLSKSLPPIWP